MKARRVFSPILTLAVSTLVLVVLWVGFLEAFAVDDFVGKGPSEVWTYLFNLPNSGESRSLLFAALGTTLTHAALGFFVGGLFSVLVAVSFVLWKPVERTFLPVAMVLRSVPIVAMVPLLAQVFGRETVGVTVVVGIIVFFPTLVLVSTGLRSITDEAVELLMVYDAGPAMILRKIRMPSALPSLFAAARVAAPGAILGALLTEWLVTGDGLGFLMLSAVTTSQYSQLWSATVLVAAVSILLFTVVTVLERQALERFAPAARQG